jgi:hypothetical protein
MSLRLTSKLATWYGSMGLFQLEHIQISQYFDLVLRLAEELDEDERVEADDGYIGEAPHKVKCPGSVSNPKEKEHMQACTRMRQETINMRIKQWEICKQTYRHDITQHGYVFRAVAVIVQIAIENGEPLFEVDYSDLY